MRQKFFIVTSFVVLIFVLIGLNAASYVKKEQTPDSEINPNRSSYNTGATGTQAFHDLLAETGRTVSRWRSSPSDLLINDKNRPDTLVLIGETRRALTDNEIEQILRWVSQGGKLVLIDREPPTELLKTTASWNIFAEAETSLPSTVDPSDTKQMTEKTPAAKPSQPTVYTNKVNAVQASQFASAINFERVAGGKAAISDSKPEPLPLPTFSTSKDAKYPAPPKAFSTPESDSKLKTPPVETDDEDFYEADAPPSKVEKSGTITTLTEGKGIGTGNGDSINSPAPTAPVAHLVGNGKTLLADFPLGSGQIVFLSDPFIVSNGGINLVDNAQLAINLVASGKGIIAFDEYHQGFGAGQNRLLDYFAGTPLTAIFLQFAALVAVILFTQSRRFARPLPAAEPNRLSKLEYVGAMAELQQRTKAFDLAMENIYKDFRRRVSRLVGADALKTSRSDLAQLIAERIKSNPVEIEKLLEKCENIMHGEPTSKKEMLSLIGKLREVEEKLGLKRNRRAKL